MRWFDGFVALVIAGLTAYLVAQPPLRGLEGMAYDLLLRARHEVYGQESPPQPSPVVVVALDQETALRPPFDRLPQELWTPQIAAVMQRTLDAGALVIGQQQAFAGSANGVVDGYDADYLALLNSAGADGRMVLGRRAPAADRPGPAPEHVEAVGGSRNLRRIGLHPDTDGVLRHAALFESSGDDTGTVSLHPSLAMELAARVIGERPHLLNGSTLVLGRYAVPGSDKNAMLMNFQGGGGGIPVFSLGDLYACSQDGGEAFFRKHFDDKVVLFGRTDAPSARGVAAARFLNMHNADRYAERCHLPVMQSLVGLDSTYTTPEVVVTATAVRNLLQRDAVKTLPGYAAVLASGLLALATALAVLRISPALVVPGVLLLLFGWSYLAVVMLARETWLMPLAQPATAIIIACACTSAYRALRRLGPQGHST